MAPASAREKFGRSRKSKTLRQESVTYEPPGPELAGGWAGLLRAFGPGAVIASVTVGTGETIFAPRVGAAFGYALLWVVVAAVFFKAVQVYTGARYLVLTGEHPLRAWTRIPGPRAWVAKLIGVVSVAAVILTATGLSFIQTYGVVERVSTLILCLKVVLIFVAVLLVKPDWGAALW